MSTQSNVLTIFLRQPGVPISGEHIAKDLNLSRTAIWKAINELKKAGHKIESIPNQGYLYTPTDILSVERLRQELRDDLPELRIKVEDELASTNQTLKKLAIDGCQSPTLLVTHEQTKTRGRFGREYFAAKNGQGVYFSLLLTPQQKFGDVTQYTLITAVAMARTIDTLSEETVSIKWVNDIYLAGKKVAGILSEAISDFETQTISAIIIGIGTNFSIPAADFPVELQERATSIFPTGETTVSRNQFIATFIRHFFQLLTDNQSDFLTEYRERSFVLGREVSFRQNQQEFHGTATGISETGELEVRLTDGTRMSLSSGEISLTQY